MRSHCLAVATRTNHMMTIVVLSALILVSTALPSLAASVNIFGPKEFVRSEGQPDVITTTFALPAGVTQCQLFVTGADGGPLAANNVSVTVNGTEMVTAKDLRANHQQQEAVSLGAENELVITLKGKPGDAVTVTITGEATNPTAPPVPPMPPMPPRPTMPTM